MLVFFITHPDVIVEPGVPVPQWRLSARGAERMGRLADQAWVSGVEQIFSSQEQKAIDGAEILSRLCQVPVHRVAELGENDRSATGYLPKKEFESIADQFFARPHESVRGWESAAAAQKRIVGAVRLVVEAAGPARVIVIVSHGGVGGLLLCSLKSHAISRALDQPGSSGGNFFLFEMPASRLIHGWKPIDGSRDLDPGGKHE